MPRSYKLYLDVIRTAIARIEPVAHDLDEATFQARGIEADAILFNLVMIGEAAENVPPEIRNLIPEIDWNHITRFKGFVALHNIQIDMYEVWDIVHNDLPHLKGQIEKLLALLEG